MTDSCATFAQLAKESAAQQAKYTEAYNIAREEKTQMISNIDKMIADVPLVNRNKASYGSFWKLVDGIDGDARKRQLISFCSTTAGNGYPAGAFTWLGDQTPDSTGRVINWCLDNGYAGSCQTRGTCVVSDEYLARLDAERNIIINDLIAKRELVRSERDKIVELKAQIVNVPACCQALVATGANLNVPVINQTCQISAPGNVSGNANAGNPPVVVGTIGGPVAGPVATPPAWAAKSGGVTTTPSSGMSTMTIIIIIVAIVLGLGLVMTFILLSGDSKDGGGEEWFLTDD